MTKQKPVLDWLDERLKDPFVSLEALPQYLAARRPDGSVYLYGRQLTPTEVDEVAKALPRLLGSGPAALEAELLSPDRKVSQKALSAAKEDALLGLLQNSSSSIRAAVLSELDKRAESATDDALAETLRALVSDLGDVLEQLSPAERRDLERFIRRGLTAKRRGAVRVEAIGCLLRCSPNARGELSGATVDERRAAAAALHGHAGLMDFLLDDDAAVVAKSREGLAALAPDELINHATTALSSGSAQEQRSALVAIEPLLAVRWRSLLEPLTQLTKKARGQVRTEAAEALAQLARGRRLSRPHLEQVVEALERVPEQAQTVATLKALLEGNARDADPLRVIELQLEAGQPDAAWAVYADALQAAGDVRGELVMLADKPKKFDAALTKHRSALFGPLSELLGKHLPRQLERLTWRHGFVESAVVNGLDDHALEDVLEALLGAPVARFLSKLELGLADPSGHDNDYAGALERLNESGGGHLIRSLFLGSFDDEDAQMSWAPWGDVSALWTSCPSLVELKLRGATGPVGTIRGEHLESLTIETGGLARETVQAIAKAKLPRLKHLEVWFGSSEYGAECESADVAALLARKDAQLTSLGLCNAEFTHELIPMLAGWKGLKQLEVLDLSLGVLTDDDVDALLTNAKAFAHLRLLDLQGNHLERSVKEVKKALPNAVLKDQRESDGDRYVAVGE